MWLLLHFCLFRVIARTGLHEDRQPTVLPTSPRSVTQTTSTFPLGVTPEKLAPLLCFRTPQEERGEKVMPCRRTAACPGEPQKLLRKNGTPQAEWFPRQEHFVHRFAALAVTVMLLPCHFTCPRTGRQGHRQVPEPQSTPNTPRPHACVSTGGRGGPAQLRWAAA